MTVVLAASARINAAYVTIIFDIRLGEYDSDTRREI